MKLRGIFSVVVAIASGALVLAGFLFGRKADGAPSLLGEIQVLLLNVAIILAAFAVLVGIANLLLVHTSKVSRKQKGGFYSLILIVALLVTFLVGLAAHYLPVAASTFNDIFSAIQLPVEASLMAVLAVTLTYASIRLLRRRLSLVPIIFLVTALLVLIGSVPLPFVGNIPILSDLIRPLINQVLATAGARGILIGVALGTLTTGLRVLLGADRPYEGK